jgi:hypothetical protein
LLSKGLKYNLHHKHKKWIETLALEAEATISNLDVTEQNFYRHMVVINIKNVSNKANSTSRRNKEEWKLMTTK